MSDATHTPGPWTYESDHTHRQFNVRMLGHLIGAKDEAKHICTINNLPTHVLANRDPATAEANARLIAAAPDLLAALQYLLAQTIEQDENFDVELTEGEQEAAQMARNAIAKARGE